MLFYSKRLHFKKLDSTSAYLLRRRFVLKNFTFVSCDFQTDGRGRLSRTWNSNDGENLLFSFLIKDKALVDNFSSLSILTAVCVIKSLNKIGVNNLSFKWPNDVYANGKKICGVLLNSVSFGDKIEELVIGVGINVNQTVFEFDSLHSPTSIRLQLGKTFCVKKLKRKIYSNIIKNFNALKKGDYSYLDFARRYNYLKNKSVFAQINGKTQSVKVIDVNPDNSLKIQVNDEILSINSGEITFHV